MNKLISIDDNRIAWIENEEGEIFGVVNTSVVLDSDGLQYENCTMQVLENDGFEIELDWENDEFYIEFREENGESPKLIFNNQSARVE